MTETAHIDFGDPRGLADLGTYLARASRANPDGAVRLQVLGNLLVTTVAVIEGTGLLGDGTVLGMRVVTIAPSAAVDTTVSIVSVNDRLARDGNGAVLSVPRPPCVHRGAGSRRRVTDGSLLVSSTARSSNPLRSKASRRSRRARPPTLAVTRSTP